MELTLITLIVLFVGVAVGFYLRKAKHDNEIAAAKTKANAIVKAAQNDAKKQASALMAENKAETLDYRQNNDDEMAVQIEDIDARERRLSQRQSTLDQITARLDGREAQISEKNQISKGMRQEWHARLDTANALIQTRHETLNQNSGWTDEETRAMILNETAADLKEDADIEIRDQHDEAEATAERVARNLVLESVQRGVADVPRDHAEHAITVSNNEVKSRLIGRDGQHIRLIETLTGVDLIFDPDDQMDLFISTHDPVRREIAHLALTNLIGNRKVSVAVIENTIQETEDTINNGLYETGEHVVSQLRVGWMHPDLMKVLGRLKYRTSYGQNVLAHSIEVAQMAAVMAAELGLNVRLAKRAGLLHDIGKAIDHEVDGTHVEIGVELARTYDEDAVVENAIAAHHGDVEMTNEISALVATADGVSGARPGARSESVEDYLNRLKALEAIASAHDGVSDSYAIQAGREIRIVVKPKQIDDEAAQKITEEVRDQIENDLTYPGKIKVTTIREMRAVEYVGGDPKTKKKKKKAS